MSLKNKISDVIQRHKNGLCFLLGIKPNDFHAEDIKVMANYLTYKAGDSHTASNGKPDKGFLNAIRDLPPEKKCEQVLFEACAWKESGELRSMSLSDALQASPMFSPRVEAALEKMRVQTYRKETRAMAVKTAKLGEQMQKLEALLLSPQSPDNPQPRSFNDPDFKREFSKEAKKLGHMFTGMNYHLKGVMLYAVKSGYTPEEAGKAIQRVYLSRVNKIIVALSAVDDLLNANGVTSNLSARARKEHKKWSDIIEGYTTNKGKNFDEQPSVNGK